MNMTHVIRTVSGIACADRPNCVLDIRHPAGVTGFTTVVWFHGGGLTDGERHFIPIVDQGIAQVAADYRLLGRDAVRGECDALVCGGGPAGCAAALAARREGLDVLLVESRGQLGGTGTSGLVTHWLGGRMDGGREWGLADLMMRLHLLAGVSVDFVDTAS